MRRPRTPALESRVEAFLLTMLKAHDTGYWRLKDLCALTEVHFGNNMDGIVRRVRSRLVTVHGFDRLKAPGQPVLGTRPSTMTPAALRRLIEDTPDLDVAAAG